MVQAKPMACYLIEQKKNHPRLAGGSHDIVYQPIIGNDANVSQRDFL